MPEVRWRVGTKLGRTLYRDGQCVGMVDTREMASEIVDALNGAAPNDREGIARALSHEANSIFNKQTQDYPSNIMDRIAANIRAGKTEGLSLPPEWWPKT